MHYLKHAKLGAATLTFNVDSYVTFSCLTVRFCEETRCGSMWLLQMPSLFLLCAQSCCASCPSANTILVTCACVSPPLLLELFPNIQLATSLTIFCFYREQSTYISFHNSLLNVTTVIIASVLTFISRSHCFPLFLYFTTITLCCLQSGQLVGSVGRTCPKKFGK